MVFFKSAQAFADIALFSKPCVFWTMQGRERVYPRNMSLAQNSSYVYTTTETWPDPASDLILHAERDTLIPTHIWRQMVMRDAGIGAGMLKCCECTAVCVHARARMRIHARLYMEFIAEGMLKCCECIARPRMHVRIYTCMHIPLRSYPNCALLRQIDRQTDTARHRLAERWTETKKDRQRQTDKDATCFRLRCTLTSARAPDYGE
jgi:hypothetical protein